MEDIDYSFNQSLDQEKITELGRLDFIEAKENVIIYRPARSRQEHNCNRGAESLFFQVIRQRYEKNSFMIMTNLPMGRWDELFTGRLAATAIPDRLVHHCHVLSITGDSYRVKGLKQSVK